ncbi:ATP-binding protein [Vibrio profundum]|uniref:HAMP domain-containing sensor histidine kinase n=1 Tax=Vibrio profundum TaxID=2910247 RepID=UPI003D0E22FB
MNSTNNVYNKINTFISLGLDTVRVGALLPAFKLYLTDPKNPMKKELAKGTLITLSRKDHVNILSYALLDMSGEVLVDSYRPNQGKNESETECYNLVVDNKVPSISGITFSDNFIGVSVINFCAIIKYRQQAVGIIRLRYNSAVVINAIKENTLEENTNFFILLDESNIRITHSLFPELEFKPVTSFNQDELESLVIKKRILSPNKVVPNIELPELERLLNISDNNATFVTELTAIHDINKVEKSYVVVKTLDYLPWKLLGAQPQNVFDASIMQQQRKALWLVFVIVLLVVLFSLLASRLMTKNLNKLTKFVATLKPGDAFEKVTIKTGDEMEVLAESFNSMANRVNISMLELESSFHKIEKTEREVRTLNQELETRVKDRTKELRKSLYELKRAQEKLVIQEKMASLGRLVAGVAHEMNTPIGIGVTSASFLSGESKRIRENFETGKLSEYDLMVFLNQIEESGEMLMFNLKRASDMITSFKKIAISKSNDNAITIDLKHQIELLILTLKPKLKKNNVTIDFYCSGSLYISCEPNEVNQIFEHLILNAMIHGYGGNSSGHIKLEVLDENEAIKINVIDYGNGISEENIKHIFDPFFTTNRKFGGTGLGMHLVYNIIHQKFNGTIECKSTLGKGSTFTINIPKAWS